MNFIARRRRRKELLRQADRLEARAHQTWEELGHAHALQERGQLVEITGVSIGEFIDGKWHRTGVGHRVPLYVTAEQLEAEARALREEAGGREHPHYWRR